MAAHFDAGVDPRFVLSRSGLPALAQAEPGGRHHVERVSTYRFETAIPRKP